MYSYSLYPGPDTIIELMYYYYTYSYSQADIFTFTFLSFTVLALDLFIKQSLNKLTSLSDHSGCHNQILHT